MSQIRPDDADYQNQVSRFSQSPHCVWLCGTAPFFSNSDGHCCLVSLQAILRPHLFWVVIGLERRFALGQLQPGHLGASIDMNIRSNRTGVVKRSHANELDLRPAAVVTPKRNLAFAAAINVVWSVSTGNRDGLQSPADDLYRRSFDDGIDDKCAAGVPLTIRAVAAVHPDRRRQ